MKDSCGRTIEYMRISITDRCNLRCQYCMPDGTDKVSMKDILTYEEILSLTRCAAQLGIRWIKITGGEPLVRKNCVFLIRELKKIPGIEKVTLTTNGILLPQYGRELWKAGLDGVNISLDTMDREDYIQLTGFDGLVQVLEGLEMMKSLVPVKINCVSIKERVEKQWKNLVDLCRTSQVDVRFIELMPIGLGRQFPSMDNQEILEQIKREYPQLKPDERRHENGPAVYYHCHEWPGSVGFISAVHKKFCSGCNRIRLTARGRLKTCLCYDQGVDLLSMIRRGAEDEEIRKAMEKAVWEKPAAHCFDRPEEITEEDMMSGIGG